MGCCDCCSSVGAVGNIAISLSSLASCLVKEHSSRSKIVRVS